MSLEAANREVYLLLKEGIRVSVPDRERGGQKTERLRVVDWEHPANNDFLLVSQFSVTGALGSLIENYEGFCGEGFWLGTRRRGRSIPAAGCDGRANAGSRQKIRRPEGFRAKVRLASLFLGHRPLRVCSLVAPRHPAFSPETEPLAILNQTLNPCRPDLVGFVNGLPLLVMELKKPGVRESWLEAGFTPAQELSLSPAAPEGLRVRSIPSERE